MVKLSFLALTTGINNVARRLLYVLSSVQVGVGELALQVGALEAKLSQVRTNILSCCT